MSKLPKKLFKTNGAKNSFLSEWNWYMDTWERIFKLYKAKSWKDLADRVYSQYIRLKNADKNGICTCVTCWVKKPRKEIQNWHYRSRACLKYRFNDENCHPQCYNCNINLSGNYRNYYKYIINTYGEEKEDKLWNDKKTVKYNQEWYEKNILHWFLEINNILKGLTRKTK